MTKRLVDFYAKITYILNDKRKTIYDKELLQFKSLITVHCPGQCGVKLSAVRTKALHQFKAKR